MVELLGFGATFAVTQVSSRRTVLIDHRGYRFPSDHQSLDPDKDMDCAETRNKQGGAGYIGWTCC